MATSTMLPADQCALSSPRPTSAKKRSIGPPLNGTGEWPENSSASHAVFCANMSCI